MRTTRTWSFRLLTTYLPILYILTFVLLFVFFMTVNQLSQRQTVRANEAFTKYAMQRLDSTLVNIDQIVNSEISSNKEFSYYMFQKYNEDMNPYLLGSKVSDRFRQIKMSFPFIYSIYFYRSEDMSILSSETYLPLNRFGDKMFLLNQFSQPIASSWSEVRRYKDFDTQDIGIPIVSLVKKVPMLSDPKGMLVVNLDLASLQNWLGDLSAGSISYVKLYDKQGQLMGKSKDAGDSDLLTLTSEVSGWSLKSGLNPDYHYGIFTDLYYSWLLLGAAMVLLASIGTVLLSRSYSRPIDASLSRISEFFNNKPLGPSGHGKEMLQYVDLAVDQIIDYANRYQFESNTNLPYRQKHFFQELLTGDREIVAEEIHEEMKQFGFTAEWKSCGVALLEIDRMPGFVREYSYRDQYLLKFVLTNVLKETADQYGLEVWSEWLSVDTLGILFGNVESVPQDQACSVCSGIKGWIESNLKFTVTIGVGAVTATAQLDEIRLSCSQARKALEYKSALGNNRVIDYMDIARRTETELFDMLQLIRTIVQLYKNGNDDWKSQFGFLFSAVGRGLYTHDEIINLFHYMSFTFTRELSEFPTEYLDIWKQEAMNTMSDALSTFDTLEDLRSAFFDSLLAVSDKWKAMREQRNHRSVMHKVRSYIEEHYGNCDLSLQLLSEEFHLSKSYLSRLFKDEIGENFIDYVTHVRMQTAIRMLAETELSIQDIAQQVGYEHYFTFNRAFKKSTGFPPSDFRKKQDSFLL